MRRRYPPYGRLLAKRMARPDTWRRNWVTSPDGKRVSLFVLAGVDAWRLGHEWIEHRLLAVSAPDSDPTIYDWSILAGHPPILVWPCGRCGSAHLECLICALIRDGCERVLALRPRCCIRYLAEEVS